MDRLKILKLGSIVVATVTLLLAVYVTLYPFWPEIVFATHVDQFSGYAYKTNISTQALGEKADLLPPIPDSNRLVIPRIYVNAPISEGETESALDVGMWRRPNTSTPDQGGNTVIVGHRVFYTSGPETFYQLDKLQADDLILVYWKGKEYVYKVFEVSIATPDQAEIEFNTAEPIITLYTCTPRWTAEKRLVVKANLQR